MKKKKNIGLTRRKANELLSEVIERARQINASPDEDFLYTVKRVAVFGSYLTDKEKLGDLDIAIDFEKRWTFDNFEEKLRNLKGRKGSGLDQIFFPEVKMWRFLKNRSTGISLHTWKDIEKTGYDHRVIFEAERGEE